MAFVASTTRGGRESAGTAFKSLVRLAFCAMVECISRPENSGVEKIAFPASTAGCRAGNEDRDVPCSLGVARVGDGVACCLIWVSGRRMPPPKLLVQEASSWRSMPGLICSFVYNALIDHIACAPATP